MPDKPAPRSASEMLDRLNMPPADGPVELASMVASADDMREYHRDRNLRLHAAKTPPRFRGAVTDHPQVLDWVSRYAKNRHSGESLLLLGPTGTGKTHAAYGALRELAELGVAHLSWRAAAEADLLAECRALDGAGEQSLNRYLAADLLLVDDLGTSKRTEFAIETTRRIVDYRYVNRLPMVITTNLELEATRQGVLDLPSAIGARTASRLAEMTALVFLDGDDRRYGGAR